MMHTKYFLHYYPARVHYVIYIYENVFILIFLVPFKRGFEQILFKQDNYHNLDIAQKQTLQINVMHELNLHVVI